MDGSVLYGFRCVEMATWKPSKSLFEIENWIIFVCVVVFLFCFVFLLSYFQSIIWLCVLCFSIQLRLFEFLFILNTKRTNYCYFLLSFYMVSSILSIFTSLIVKEIAAFSFSLAVYFNCGKHDGNLYLLHVEDNFLNHYGRRHCEQIHF